MAECSWGEPQGRHGQRDVQEHGQHDAQGQGQGLHDVKEHGLHDVQGLHGRHDVQGQEQRGQHERRGRGRARSPQELGTESSQLSAGSDKSSGAALGSTCVIYFQQFNIYTDTLMTQGIQFAQLGLDIRHSLVKKRSTNESNEKMC